MKIVFMGTPEPAAEILKTLIGAKEEIVCVVTQPDRKKGRGLKTFFSAVKELALRQALPLLQPEKAKDPVFVSFIKSLEPDLIVVVAYGQILPPDLLKVPKFGCLNIHASLLPKYRGAAPIEYAILKGEKETGITIMQVEETLDTGPILLQDMVSVSAVDTASSLEKKLFELGSKLIVKALELIKEGKANFKKQDESKASYAPRLRKELGAIDWKSSAQEIHNRIRAFDPWPGAYTFYKEKPLKIWESMVIEEVEPQKGAAGAVFEIVKKKGFKINTAKGSLLVLAVQPEAGKRMNAFDFVNGYGLNKGTILPN